MRGVFDRHAGSKGMLSAPELIAALEEVGAPVLSDEGSSTESIFRRADTDLSGAVDFAECEPVLQLFARFTCRPFANSISARFKRAAHIPDELELLLEDDRLSVQKTFVHAACAAVLVSSPVDNLFLEPRPGYSRLSCRY